jgi:hypothetical protein
VYPLFLQKLSPVCRGLCHCSRNPSYWQNRYQTHGVFETMPRLSRYLLVRFRQLFEIDFSCHQSQTPQVFEFFPKYENTLHFSFLIPNSHKTIISSANDYCKITSLSLHCASMRRFVRSASLLRLTVCNFPTTVRASPFYILHYTFYIPKGC